MTQYPLQHTPRKYLYATDYNPHQQQNYTKKLQQQIQMLKQKNIALQQSTIKDQMNVLEQIDILEERFCKVTCEKQQLQQQLNSLSVERLQYKKIKGIGDGLVDMMRKVEGKGGSARDAWKWVKKVVGEYELIKKKALKWKQVYDRMKNANNTFDDVSISSDEDTFSNQ